MVLVGDFTTWRGELNCGVKLVSASEVGKMTVVYKYSLLELDELGGPYVIRALAEST